MNKEKTGVNGCVHHTHTALRRSRQGYMENQESVKQRRKFYKRNAERVSDRMKRPVSPLKPKILHAFHACLKKKKNVDL